MTEQGLKVVLQGVIDGKEIQRACSLTSTWIPVTWDTVSALIAGLVAYHSQYQFRVKPEVKVFKYQTRPYMAEYFEGEAEFGVWCTTPNYLSPICSNTKSFRWLVEATEHEVEYE
jgi:DNA-binding LytR/AlgR family response regulator